MGKWLFRLRLLKPLVALFLLWQVSGGARADALTELDWQATLQTLYRDIGNAYTDFINSLETQGSPNAFRDWVDSFTRQPFSDRDVVQEMNDLSSALQSQFNDQQLSAHARQQLNIFVGILQNVSSDMAGAIAGSDDLSNSRRLEALKQLESLHDRDQAWVNDRGQQLAEKFEHYDVEGAIRVLENIVDDYNR